MQCKLVFKKIIKCGHGQYTGVLKWAYFEFSDFVKEKLLQKKDVYFDKEYFFGFLPQGINISQARVSLSHIENAFLKSNANTQVGFDIEMAEEEFCESVKTNPDITFFDPDTGNFQHLANGLWQIVFVRGESDPGPAYDKNAETILEAVSPNAYYPELFYRDEKKKLFGKSEIVYEEVEEEENNLNRLLWEVLFVHLNIQVKRNAIKEIIDF